MIMARMKRTTGHPDGPLILGRCTEPIAYFMSRNKARPAGDPNSLASNVPSLSGSAALKSCPARAMYSSCVRVPSRSGSADANCLALTRPRNSRASSVPSLSRSNLANVADAACCTSVRSSVPSLSEFEHFHGAVRRGKRRYRKRHGSGKHYTKGFTRFHN